MLERYPVKTKRMSTQLVTVATFDTPIDAEIAKNKLESVGVRAFLADEATIRMASYLGPAMGGVKLLVLDSDVESARSVLEPATVRPSEGAGEAGGASEASDEPAQDREVVAPVRSHQRLGAVLLVIAGGVILVVFLFLIVSDILAG